MQTLQRVIYGISTAAAGLACFVLIAMVGHILYEIVLRTVFSSSTFVLDEFVGYGVAAATFLALGHVLENGSLIRVNILLSRLSPGARRAMEALCASLTLAVVLVLTWFIWLRVARHWVRGSTSSSIAQVPLWIPEGAILLGLCVFALQLLAYLLRQIEGGPPPVVLDPVDAAAHCGPSAPPPSTLA